MSETELWYKKMGFAENPFSIKPAIYSDSVYGYPNVIAEVAKSIAAGKVVFVRGNYGNGKSTMLKHLLKKFGGQGKLAYFSCNRLEDRLDVKRILNGRYGFFGKVFDLKPKNMILLLDEAQHLAKEDFNAIMHYFDSGNLKSVVFVAKEPITESMPERLQRAVSVHNLDAVSSSDAVAIVRKRIGHLGILSDDIIKDVFKKSGFNVRVMLKNCEMLCRYAINKGLNSVNSDLVELLPSSNEEKQKEQAKPREEIRQQPVVSVPRHFEPLVRAIKKQEPVQDYSSKRDTVEPHVEKEIEESFEAKPVESLKNVEVSRLAESSKEDIRKELLKEEQAEIEMDEPIIMPDPKDPLSEGLFDEETKPGLPDDEEKKSSSAEELYY
ncbi:MAG: AAA family ATPase [Candidatus Nanoarchaeia archaeon]|jgi:hypothetical protein